MCFRGKQAPVTTSCSPLVSQMLAKILNTEYIQGCSETEEERRKPRGRETHLSPPWPSLKRTILTPRCHLEGSASRKCFYINLYEVNGKSKASDQRNAPLLHGSWGGGLMRRTFRLCPERLRFLQPRRALRFELDCQTTPAALGTTTTPPPPPPPENHRGLYL